MAAGIIYTTVTTTTGETVEMPFYVDNTVSPTQWTPVKMLVDPAGGIILGSKTDAKNSATDGSSVSGMSVWKQMSASLQLLSGTGASTDKSGTITLGGTAQVAIASNSSRKGWVLINNSDTDMFVRVGGTAANNVGIPLYPREFAFGYEIDDVSLFCATTGKVFTAWEYV